MMPLLGMLAGLLITTGIVTAATGLQRTPVRPPRPRRATMAPRWCAIPRATRIFATAGLAAGLIIALTTGWVIALVALPAMAVILPILLSGGRAQDQIRRLEAMEEWTRAMSDVLTVGVGIEQAIIATAQSAPDPIKPEVTTLAARLHARWTTGEAIRAFADDLNDETGDLIAANLLLGTSRRGAGLSVVLKSLAESVAADVRARRQVEADRAKPRTTARWVTLITIVVLSLLFLNGGYVAPYGTPLGQAVLAVLLTSYLLILIWMKRMTVTKPLPRFIGASIRSTSGA